MKSLKFIFGLIYPILIILLLANLKNCSTLTPNLAEIPALSKPVRPRPEPMDSMDVVRQAERTGNNGALKVTLLWDFQGDIDLHIKQPNGKEIYFQNPKDSSTGGFLDVDNQNGGNGAAENIYWENPQKGEYTVSLVYYQASRSTSIAESGTCTIVVFRQGNEPQTYEVEMEHVTDRKNVVKIDLE